MKCCYCFFKKYVFVLQQEENNNIPNTCTTDGTQTTTMPPNTMKNAQMVLEMRKFNIAAANPILAEKLATPSEQTLQQLENSSTQRPQLATLTPKIEKGKCVYIFYFLVILFL